MGRTNINISSQNQTPIRDEKVERKDFASETSIVGGLVSMVLPGC